MPISACTCTLGCSNIVMTCIHYFIYRCLSSCSVWFDNAQVGQLMGFLAWFLNYLPLLYLRVAGVTAPTWVKLLCKSSWGMLWKKKLLKEPCHLLEYQILITSCLFKVVCTQLCLLFLDVWLKSGVGRCVVYHHSSSFICHCSLAGTGMYSYPTRLLC